MRLPVTDGEAFVRHHEDVAREFSELGSEGWDLISIKDEIAFFKRVIPNGKPVGLAKTCSNCKCFKPADDEITEKSGDQVSGWCNEWKLAMAGMGTCDGFAEKDWSIPNPAGSPPDEESAWHWLPRTDVGEKRVEAVTSEVAGIQSPSHKHRVVVIMDRHGSVVRGKTDMINGHDHNISLMGMADEADGHTHTFEIPRG
jgi:hypothetical protein